MLPSWNLFLRSRGETAVSQRINNTFEKYHLLTTSRREKVLLYMEQVALIWVLSMTLCHPIHLVNDDDNNNVYLIQCF